MFRELFSRMDIQFSPEIAIRLYHIKYQMRSECVIESCHEFDFLSCLEFLLWFSRHFLTLTDNSKFHLWRIPVSLPSKSLFIFSLRIRPAACLSLNTLPTIATQQLMSKFEGLISTITSFFFVGRLDGRTKYVIHHRRYLVSFTGRALILLESQIASALNPDAWWKVVV